MEQDACQYLPSMAAAFGAIWLLLFGYLLRLRSRERHLRKALAEIRFELQRRAAQEGPGGQREPPPAG